MYRSLKVSTSLLGIESRSFHTNPEAKVVKAIKTNTWKFMSFIEQAGMKLIIFYQFGSKLQLYASERNSGTAIWSPFHLHPPLWTRPVAK